MVRHQSTLHQEVRYESVDVVNPSINHSKRVVVALHRRTGKEPEYSASSRASTVALGVTQAFTLSMDACATCVLAPLPPPRLPAPFHLSKSRPPHPTPVLETRNPSLGRHPHSQSDGLKENEEEKLAKRKTAAFFLTHNPRPDHLPVGCWPQNNPSNHSSPSSPCSIPHPYPPGPSQQPIPASRLKHEQQFPLPEHNAQTLRTDARNTRSHLQRARSSNVVGYARRERPKCRTDSLPPAEQDVSG